MKICKLYIKDYQQFKDFELDLTYPKGHPKAGEPLEKVCLIGSNGTGKTTLLKSIYTSTPLKDIAFPQLSTNSITTYKFNNSYYYYVKLITAQKYLLFDERINSIENWQEKIMSSNKRLNLFYNHYGVQDRLISDMLINIPAEGDTNTYSDDFQNATLNDSLKLFDNFPSYHQISPDTLKSFWQLLIYQIKKRENDFRDFQNKEENLDKTIRQVRDEFDAIQPKILAKIAVLWDKILGKAGLEFDVEGASNPIQLNDNLLAYIRLKSTKERIPYNQLSTGIRNFIFRLGHIFTLYFGRDIQRGFLLLDEPENSLHPDFLYDLIDIYTGIIQNTQFITATHSPIIAAQFEPYERFVLEFNEEGYVTVRRGTTPAGDDPNDILKNDFQVRSLLGSKGVEKWERYLELKSLIENESDKSKKMTFLEEFMAIGNAYNFPLK